MRAKLYYFPDRQHAASATTPGRPRAWLRRVLASAISPARFLADRFAALQDLAASGRRRPISVPVSRPRLRLVKADRVPRSEQLRV
jgi:hypothetical protein